VKNYIIHLPKIPASKKTAEEMYKKFCSWNEDVELFEGTMGYDAVAKFEKEGRTLWPKTLKGHPIENVKHVARKMSSPGVKGCFDSHYRLWKKCYKLGEPITIWEDDIILERKFIPVEWDDVLIVALGHPTKSKRWLPFLENPSTKPEALKYSSPSMPGCCGYAIKPDAAKILIDTYDKTYRPADNAINRSLVKMQIHTHIMGIAKVAGKKSLTRTDQKFWNNVKDNLK